MLKYWVCPKGQRYTYGTIVTDFKSMMHYYFLYTHGDDKAEIYYVRSDKNIADKFLKIFYNYYRMKAELKNDCLNDLGIPFEED